MWRYNAVISVENSRGSEEGNHPPAPGQCRIVDRARGLGCWSSRLSSDLRGSAVWITALSLYQLKMKALCLLESTFMNRNCNKTDCFWNYENVVKVTLKRDLKIHYLKRQMCCRLFWIFAIFDFLLRYTLPFKSFRSLCFFERNYYFYLARKK